MSSLFYLKNAILASLAPVCNHGLASSHTTMSFKYEAERTGERFYVCSVCRGVKTAGKP